MSYTAYLWVIPLLWEVGGYLGDGGGWNYSMEGGAICMKEN